MGNHAPGRTGGDDPAQGIEDLTQSVTALRSVLSEERKVRSDEGPFLVADIAGIRRAGTHASSITPPTPEVITRSSRVLVTLASRV